jgi:hypothetical protein
MVPSGDQREQRAADAWLKQEALTKSSSSRPSSMLPIIVSVLGLSRAP